MADRGSVPNAEYASKLEYLDILVSMVDISELQSIQRKDKVTVNKLYLLLRACTRLPQKKKKKEEKSADSVCRRDMPAYYLEISGRWRNSLLKRINYYYNTFYKPNTLKMMTFCPHDSGFPLVCFTTSD